jgi:serine/threonine protein kinase
MRRIVALKVMRDDLLSRPEALQRFRREIELAAQLKHVNIVTAYDAEQIGKRHCLIMEYCEGKTLARLVEDVGRLPAGRACALVRQAALGLEHAHERGMIHRDIKPENLLLTQGTVKILDFGLARLQIALTRENPLTRLGTVLGTPDFMAPEQARDLHTADARSDLYSLGCTFYFLLAGRVPFVGGNLSEKLLRQQIENPPPLPADVPAEVVHIVTRLMAKDMAQRFQSARELADCLEPMASPSVVTDGSGVAEGSTEVGWSNVAIASLPAPMPTPKVEANTPSRQARNPRGFLILGVGALLLAGFLVISVGATIWRLSRTPIADPENKLDKEQESPVVSKPKEKPKEQPALTTGWKWRQVSQESILGLDHVQKVAFAPDGKRIAVAFGRANDPKSAGKVRIWRVDGDKLVVEQTWDVPFTVFSVAFSPTGEYVAYGGAPSKAQMSSVFVRRLGAEDKEPVAKLNISIKALAFSPATGQLFTGGENGVISAWEATTGKSLGALPGNTGAPVRDLSFSSDGKLLAYVSERNAGVWHIANQEKQVLRPSFHGQIRAVAISRDSKILAASCTSGKDKVGAPQLAAIRLWDLESGLAHPDFLCQGALTNALAFTPDGAALLSAHDDGTLRAWKMKDIEVQPALDGPKGRMGGFALSPDASMLVVAGGESTLRVWRRVEK